MRLIRGRYDTGIPANNDTHLTRNIREVLKCVRKAGLKLTVEKCQCGVRKVEFLGGTISPEGISPQARELQDILGKLRFPKSEEEEDSSTLLGFRIFLQKLYS